MLNCHTIKDFKGENLIEIWFIRSIDNLLSISFVERFAFLIVFIGAALITGVLSKFSLSYTLPVEKIDASATGAFGDYIGGVVGTLWALAGILLFWAALKTQREELGNYKLELKNQRRELNATRSTDVIYHQLSLLERALERCEIDVEYDLVRRETIFQWAQGHAENYNYYHLRVDDEGSAIEESDEYKMHTSKHLLHFINSDNVWKFLDELSIAIQVANLQLQTFTSKDDANAIDYAKPIAQLLVLNVDRSIDLSLSSIAEFLRYYTLEKYANPRKKDGIEEMSKPELDLINKIQTLRHLEFDLFKIRIFAR